MENTINLNYGQEVNRLEIKKKDKERNILKIAKIHKLISIIIIAILMLSAFNFYLIYVFMNLLQNV